MAVGLKINDEKEEPVLELSTAVIPNNPEFAIRMGNIASSWSMAEASLASVLARMMETSPDRTFALMKPYKNASATADAAKALASATLSGKKLEDFLKIIENFKNAAEKRNRIQHDLWAIKGKDTSKIFGVRSLEYVKLNKNIDAIRASVKLTKDQKAEQVINLVNEFAKSISDAYDIARLNKTIEEIDSVSYELVQFMYN